MFSYLWYCDKKLSNFVLFIYVATGKYTAEESREVTLYPLGGEISTWFCHSYKRKESYYKIRELSLILMGNHNMKFDN